MLRTNSFYTSSVTFGISNSLFVKEKLLVGRACGGCFVAKIVIQLNLLNTVFS